MLCFNNYETLFLSIYIYTNFCFRSKERKKYFKIGRFTKRFVFCISSCKHEWVQNSLSTPLTRPCAIYVLWQKQQAGNIHVYKNKVNEWINSKKYKSLRWPSFFKIYTYIYIYIYMCVCVCIYICIYIYICVCVCVMFFFLLV